MTLAFSPFDAATELESQRALFRDCFPETIGLAAETEAFYRWKFQQFPATPPSYEYKATTPEGMLVGYYAAIPYRYNLAGTTVSCAMVCDVMTHSSMRGKGVFTKLGKYATEKLNEAGLYFASGYPVRPEVIPGHIKVGWSIAFKLPMYLQVLKTDAIFAAKKVSAFAPLANLFCRGSHFLMHTFSPADASIRIVRLSVPELLASEDYERFFAAWAKTQTNYLIKDKAFLGWRLSAPGSQYTMLAAYKGDDIVALAVARAVPLKDVPALALLDLMVLEQHPKAVPALAYALTTLARESGAEVVATMMSSDSAKKFGLLRYGYVKSPFTFSLILKDLSGQTPVQNTAQEAQWSLMWLDSDDL